jgi:hypothetical protein
MQGESRDRLAGMWNSIKSYLAFCDVALRENLPSRRLKLMRIAWVIVAFILGWIVSAYLGYKLKDVAEGIYNLLSWYSWIFIALGLVSFFLLFLINGARRYHERITKELNDAYDAEVNEWRTYADKIHRLSIVYGMALEADDIIGFCSNTLSPEAITRLNAHINNGIHNSLGTQARDNYYQNMPDLPKEGESQYSWMLSHCGKFKTLIDAELREQPIANTAASPKQLT